MKNFVILLSFFAACNNPHVESKPGDVNISLDSLKSDVKPVADSIGAGLGKAGEKVKKAVKKVDSTVKIKVH